MDPNDRPGRIVLAGLLLLLMLGACAAPATKPEGRVVAIGAVVAALAGEYAGISWSDGDAAAAVWISIDRISVAPDAAVLQMLQRDASGIERRFRLVLQATGVATRLSGSFEPLADDDSTLGSCALELIIRNEGLLARTDAASCRFGSAETAVGLIKEIAHDGNRLVIADRVVAVGTDRAIRPDRVLEAARVRTFQLWAGRRDGADAPWRMARNLEIRSDGGIVQPRDPAGMTLDVGLDLALHRLSSQGPTVLRLRAFDLNTGDLLGQAWADPAAVRLGLALEMLQAGLELSGSAQSRGPAGD